MENYNEINSLIKYGNYCLDNCILSPLKIIFHNFDNLDTQKYKNEIFLLRCKKKEILDYLSLDDSSKLKLIKTIEECKKLISNDEYEKALKILYSTSNKIKHDSLLYYKGICLYKLKKINKAEKSLRDYSYKGYTKQLDVIILLIKIYVIKKQYGKAKNYLLRYNNISKTLNKYDEKTYEELNELINSILKTNTSDTNNIVNNVIELLEKNKIKDAFDIVDNLALEPLQMAKIKLKIVEFLYKSKLNNFAKKYYNDIIRTPNKDKELKIKIKNLEIIRKLSK